MKEAQALERGRESFDRKAWADAYRLLQAAEHEAPMDPEDLERLATHCTLQEDAANKVERQVDKAAAALLMAPRIGQLFEAIVTGASPKGTFVRIFTPPVEGMLAHGVIPGVDVGDHLRVKLARVDVEKGFIDFSRAEGSV